MNLIGEKKRLAARMAQDSGAETSCYECSRKMVPVEAETQLGGEGRVFVRCENGHEDRFSISYEQAQELGLHWTRDLPETGG